MLLSCDDIIKSLTITPNITSVLSFILVTVYVKVCLYFTLTINVTNFCIDGRNLALKRKLPQGS